MELTVALTIVTIVIISCCVYGAWLNFLPLVKAVAKDTNVPPENLFALIWIESSFNPYAKNGDAVGLLQVTPQALEDVNRYLGTNYTLEELLDPEVNLRVGAVYYARLRDFFRFYYDTYTADVMAALAYNWGIGNTLKLLKASDLSPERIVAEIPPETAYFVVKFLFLRNYLLYGPGKTLIGR